MQIQVLENQAELGKAAARCAAAVVQDAIRKRGTACLIAATGASQFELLDELMAYPIEWSRTVFFHLDEYVGLPETHPASFRRYLKERIVQRVRPGQFVFIAGDDPDPAAECRRLNQLIGRYQVDLALVGIGENGHLAFNDPPADFETKNPFLVLELDEACRSQQLGEGWFSTLAEVPRRAISMSIRQILKARTIICSVPDLRKAPALRNCLENEVSPRYPASILRRHPDTTLFLDSDSASLLSPGSVARGSLSPRTD